MTPYYSHAGITIYHGDCREILPSLPKVDLVIIADPPYGVGRDYGPKTVDDVPAFVAAALLLGSQLIPVAMFAPVSRIYDVPVRPQWTGCWKKKWGGSALRSYPIYPHWEPILFYNISGDYAGNKGHRSDVFEFAPVRPTENGHPTPKPLDLMCELVRFMPAGTVCDPFMGSGTTLVAAKQLGRKAIGIEIEERYCEIAAKRLAQEVMAL